MHTTKIKKEMTVVLSYTAIRILLIPEDKLRNRS